MGCDIHLFIEYRESMRERWQALATSRFCLRQNYSVFAAMAGVRGGPDFKPSFKPRGMPEEVSHLVGLANLLYVADAIKAEGDGEVSRSVAQKWVNDGLSRWSNDDQYFITHPDWHSHSWLSPDEYQRALEASENPSPDYRAVLAALRSLEQSGCEARVVFWFDN